MMHSHDHPHDNSNAPADAPQPAHSHGGCSHTHAHTHAAPEDAQAAPVLAGERSTRQRSAIREVLAQEGRPMTPPEILEKAQCLVPKLGIATVYRNIKAMVDVGEIMAVPLPGDRLYYELAHKAHEHHHHFRCNQCDRVFDVHGCDDGFASLVPKGFEVKSHDLTLYGTCAECAKTATAGAKR